MADAPQFELDSFSRAIAMTVPEVPSGDGPAPSASVPADNPSHPNPMSHAPDPRAQLQAQQAQQGSHATSAQTYSPSRPPTSAEIDAVIAAAMANAPPAPSPPEFDRSITPLMTNLLPSSVGIDGRVNLFVGNLPYRVRWQDVKDLFRKAGTVLRADVSLGPDNRSRGYGTVLMGSREDAARAIDRFNGFNWQTRTLEVRPDRLPPEYEPQPHHSHGPPGRQQMFGYNGPSNGHPFSIPGMVPSNSWQGQVGRPQHPGGVNGFGGYAHHPQHAPGAHAPSGLARAPSPVSGYPGGTGISPSSTPTLQPFGVAPSSTSHGPGSVTEAITGRRDSLSPFAHPPALSSTARATSPLMSSGQPKPPSPHRQDVTPVRPSSGQAVPPLAAKVLHSPTASVPGSDAGHSHGATPPIGGKSNVGMAMEGLLHQGAHMGPPSTLHDRVVFVSNLPLHMQWQELKDLLRPAGDIIRADVATDGEGKPRGFGTALFATEGHAAAAVSMFNDVEIAGRRIRVSSERDSIQETMSRRGSSALVGLGHQESRQASLQTESGSESSSVQPSLLPRVPWGLNTSSTGTGINTRPAPGPIPHRHPHPGPITMPSFTPLDMSGGGNVISPLQTRGLPPMTPSMPGFVFNAFPDTPPIHQGYSSMAGPFSPGIPVTSPSAFQYNPFLNPAPGAPVSRFPLQGQGGSAALGTPTTQTFPSDPLGHARGAGAQSHEAESSNVGQIGDYFPSVGAGTSSSNGTQGPRRESGEHDEKEEVVRSKRTSSADTTDLAELAERKLSLSDSNGNSISVPASALISNLGGGRASLDLARSKLGGIWELQSGERRASFGDIVAGRNKENTSG